MGKGGEEKDALFFLLFQQLASRKNGKKNGLQKSFLELRQSLALITTGHGADSNPVQGDLTMIQARIVRILVADNIKPIGALSGAGMEAFGKDCDGMNCILSRAFFKIPLHEDTLPVPETFERVYEDANFGILSHHRNFFTVVRMTVQKFSPKSVKNRYTVRFAIRMARQVTMIKLRQNFLHARLGEIANHRNAL